MIKADDFVGASDAAVCQRMSKKFLMMLINLIYLLLLLMILKD